MVQDQKKLLLLNLIKYQGPDTKTYLCQRSTDTKIYLYVKDPLESKYHLLINGREKVGIENLKNPKAFIDYFIDY